MTNSMKERKKFITPEKAASLIPVLISAVISILLIIFFVIPKYIQSTKVNLELNELVRKKNELDKLKSQYKIINKKFDKLNKEKAIIKTLISGTSNLDTLIAVLGEVGKENNIEFISIVPKKVIKAVESNNLKNPNKTNDEGDLIVDPLLVEGTKKYIIDFTFKAEFVNLLSFLRQLEFQENVILINNIDLRLLNQSSNNIKNANPYEKLVAKLTMTFYGKN